MAVDMNENQWNITEIDNLNVLVFQMCNPLPFELKYENERNPDDFIGTASPDQYFFLDKKGLLDKASDLLDKVSYLQFIFLVAIL